MIKVKVEQTFIIYINGLFSHTTKSTTYKLVKKDDVEKSFPTTGIQNKK